MTNDFKVCKEYFRAFARVLTRVNPEFCGLATKHGEEIHKMIGYYDDLDWKLGRFYLLKTIIEVYMLDEYIHGDDYKGGLVDYFESNFEYYQLVNLYNKIRLTVTSYPCCSRHKVWNKKDLEAEWPSVLTPADKIEKWDTYVDDVNIYEVSSSSDMSLTEEDSSDEYWNSYDSSLEVTPLPDMYNYYDDVDDW